MIFCQSQKKLEARNNKKYEAKVIIDIAMYTHKTKNKLPSFYYLVLWKGYPEKKSTWKPLTAVMYFRKLISTFHKEHPEKPIATSLFLDSALPIARLIVSKKLKQKRGCPRKGIDKRVRN